MSRDAAHPGAGLKGKAQRNAPAGPDDEHAISPSLPEAPAGLDAEVQLSREKGERIAQAEALNGAGETLLATGHHQEAQACLTEALTLAEQTGYRYQQARAHRALAATCHAAGQLEQASQHRQHALDTYTDLGVPEAAQMRASTITAAQ